MIRSIAIPAHHKVHSEDAHAWRAKGGVELAVVADGVGGLEGGAQASRVVVDEMMDEKSWKNMFMARPGERMKEILMRANELVEPMPGACTVVAMRRRKNHASIAWVGDSRVYLLREGGETQLTEDDSWENWHAQEVTVGRLEPPTKEERDRHSHAIIQAVGKGMKEVHTSHLRVRPGDVLILCTDGFYETLHPGDIRELLDESGDGDEMRASRPARLAAIERELRERKPNDDATVLVWWVD